MSEAVTSHSGSTRTSRLVAVALASVAIAGLIGLGAVTGVLPTKLSPLSGEESVPRAEAKPGRTSICSLCGTVELIRTVEVLEEVGGGTPDAKTVKDKEMGETKPGFATSVLDTLSGAIGGDEPPKAARKRYAYRVTVRMDDGSFRAISVSSPPNFAVGDKVRVVEGRLVRS